MNFDYEAWLQQAQDRLEELYRQRDAIESEIADLQRGIEGFTPLVRKFPPWDRHVAESIGITSAVTKVFSDEPGRCYSATQVRDELLKRGVKLDQKNPLATIHQIISRLEERRTIKAHNFDGRRLHYFPQKDEAFPPRVVYDSLPGPSPRALASFPEPKTPKPVSAAEVLFGRGKKDSKK